MMEFNVLMDFIVELHDQKIIEVLDEDELILRLEEFIEEKASEKFSALFAD